MLDWALVAGAAGGLYGATVAALHGGELFRSTLYVGAHWAGAASGFIGVRHLLLQDNWHNDREAISAMSATIVATASLALKGDQRVIQRFLKPTILASLFGGFVGHYFHRWWLRQRLDYLEA